MDGNQPGPSGANDRFMYASLENLDTYVEQRYKNDEAKLKALRTQCEVMRVQGRANQTQYGRNHQAEHVVNHWISKHGRNVPPPGAGSARPLAIPNIVRQAETRPPPAAAGSASSAKGSASSANDSASSAKGSNVHQKCEVLNCEIEFSSLTLFISHTETHVHTPCLPVRHMIDATLTNTAPMYCCTTCGNLYKDADRCQMHMETDGHDHLQEPVAIVGWICLQCFSIYDSESDCRIHQHKEGHFKRVHGLQRDCNKRLLPQFLPQPVYDAFISACREVPSTVECLNCQKVLEDSTDMGTHKIQDHTIMAFTEKTLADVWRSIMCKFTCVQCLRLYHCPPNGEVGELHQCTNTMAGMIIENDCKTTKEFLLRLSLKKLPSENPSSLHHQASKQEKQVISNDNFMIATERREGNLYWFDSDGDSSLGISINGDGEAHLRHDIKKVITIIESPTPTLKPMVGGLRSKVPINDAVLQKSNDETDLQILPTPSPDLVPEILGLNITQNNSVTIIDSSDDEDVDIVRKVEKVKKFTFSANAGKCGKRNSNEMFTLPQLSISVASCSKESLPNRKRLSSVLIDQTTPTEVIKKQKPGAVVAQASLNTPTRKRNRSIERSIEPKTNIVTVLSTLPCKKSCTPSDKRSNLRKSSTPSRRGRRAGSSPKGSRSPRCRTPIRSLSTQHGSRYSSQSPVAGTSIIASAGKHPVMPGQKVSLPDFKTLETMVHMIFVDFDNWTGFWQRLLKPLPSLYFVWGFLGGNCIWKTPYLSSAYQKAVARGLFYLNPRCGKRKDAADFAICMHVGRMDTLLPSHIPFTILSGDRGFEELERQMEASERKRRVRVINPHTNGPTDLYTLLVSMVDS